MKNHLLVPLLIAALLGHPIHAQGNEAAVNTCFEGIIFSPEIATTSAIENIFHDSLTSYNICAPDELGIRVGVYLCENIPRHGQEGANAEAETLCTELAAALPYLHYSPTLQGAIGHIAERSSLLELVRDLLPAVIQAQIEPYSLVDLLTNYPLGCPLLDEKNEKLAQEKVIEILGTRSNGTYQHQGGLFYINDQLSPYFLKNPLFKEKFEIVQKKIEEEILKLDELLQSPAPSLLYNYNLFLKQIYTPPAPLEIIDLRIQAQYNCSQHPEIVKIMDQDLPWNPGCGFALMAAMSPIAQEVLHFANFHLTTNDPWKLASITAKESIDGALGSYSSFNQEMLLAPMTGTGTLLHELTHYILDALYHNYAVPYRAGDLNRQKYLGQATIQSLINAYKILSPEAMVPMEEQTLLVAALNDSPSPEETDALKRFIETFKTALPHPNMTQGEYILCISLQDWVSGYQTSQYTTELIVFYITELVERRSDAPEAVLQTVFEPLQAFWNDWILPDLRNAYLSDYSLEATVEALIKRIQKEEAYLPLNLHRMFQRPSRKMFWTPAVQAAFENRVINQIQKVLSQLELKKYFNFIDEIEKASGQFTLKNYIQLIEIHPIKKALNNRFVQLLQKSVSPEILQSEHSYIKDVLTPEMEIACETRMRELLVAIINGPVEDLKKHAVLGDWAQDPEIRKALYNRLVQLLKGSKSAYKLTDTHDYLKGFFTPEMTSVYTDRMRELLVPAIKSRAWGRYDYIDYIFPYWTQDPVISAALNNGVAPWLEESEDPKTLQSRYHKIYRFRTPEMEIAYETRMRELLVAIINGPVEDLKKHAVLGDWAQDPEIRKALYNRLVPWLEESEDPKTLQSRHDSIRDILTPEITSAYERRLQVLFQDQRAS
jgi:hypothetical protein